MIRSSGSSAATAGPARATNSAEPRRRQRDVVARDRADQPVRLGDRLAHPPEHRALRLALRDQRVARRAPASSAAASAASSRAAVAAPAASALSTSTRQSAGHRRRLRRSPAAPRPGTRAPARCISSKAEIVPPSACRSAWKSASAASGEATATQAVAVSAGRGIEPQARRRDQPERPLRRRSAGGAGRSPCCPSPPGSARAARCRPPSPPRPRGRGRGRCRSAARSPRRRWCRAARRSAPTPRRPASAGRAGPPRAAAACTSASTHPASAISTPSVRSMSRIRLIRSKERTTGSGPSPKICPPTSPVPPE